jgi:4-hydroxybenzoate polyprenyltransferase
MDRGVVRERRADDSAHVKDAGQPPPWFGGPARLEDYIFLVRPMILIPVWTFFILGAYHGMQGSENPDVVALVIGVLSFTALLGAIYIVNQITDRDNDRVNRKLFLIPDEIISVRAAWIEAAVLVTLSFLLGIFLSPSFMIVLAASLALGAAYSLEPVRLKRRTVLDVAANAAGNGILNTLAGWIALGAALSGWPVLIPYPFAVASVHLATTIADIEGDARTGLHTSGVMLGPRAGMHLSTGLMIAAALAAAAVGNKPALYASLFSLPFFIIPRRSRGRMRPPGVVLFPVKAATLIYAIVAGFLFPLYIPFLAVVILLTRRYYRTRFEMTYPTLSI